MNDIFSYDDEKGTWFADPLRVHHKLIATLGDVNKYLDQAEHENQQLRSAAEMTLADASRQAFGLPPFDPTTGEGTTDKTALNILHSYLEWREKNG